MEREPLYKRLYQNLRVLENEAYGSVISAFRSQGELTWNKQKILSQLQDQLNVSKNRQNIELLRVENDPVIQKIITHNIHKHREDISSGLLTSELPPIAGLPSPPITLPSTNAEDSERDYIVKKKKGRNKKIAAPPPLIITSLTEKPLKKTLPTRKRKRDPVLSIATEVIQPPLKKQKTQPKRRKSKENVKKQMQPLLPPQPIPETPKPIIYAYDVDLPSLKTFEDVEEYVKQEASVVDEVEAEWTADKDLKERDNLLSRLRSERFRIMQVLDHVQYQM